MNPRKMGTSSFSNREKMRRNPFKHRNSLSISLRLLYIARSYCHGLIRVLRGGTIERPFPLEKATGKGHGLIRVLRGGTMGVNPNANQVAVDGSLRAPDKSHRLKSSSLLTRQQASHPHQVVGRRHEVTGQPGTLHSPIPGAPEPAHRLHPSEDLLHLLADLLAHRIAPMPCGTSIYRRVLREASLLDHACPSHTAGCRNPCHLPASWDGNPAARHRPASQAQRHAQPYPWHCSPRSPSATRCRSP